MSSHAPDLGCGSIACEKDGLAPGAAATYLQVFVWQANSLFGARFRPKAMVSLPRQFPLAGTRTVALALVTFSN